MGSAVGASDDDTGEGLRTSRHSDCPPLEAGCRDDEGGAADEDAADDVAGAVGEDGEDGSVDEAGAVDAGAEDGPESDVSRDEDGVNEGLRSAGVKTDPAGLLVLTGGAMMEP